MSIFFTFYGLELLKKDLRKLKVSPLGNPAMPMKMPMGPAWFKSIRWNIPNAVQSLMPAYEAFATKMMKKTIKKTGVRRHRRTAQPLHRGRGEPDRAAR